MKLGKQFSLINEEEDENAASTTNKGAQRDPTKGDSLMDNLDDEESEENINIDEYIDNFRNRLDDEPKLNHDDQVQKHELLWNFEKTAGSSINGCAGDEEMNGTTDADVESNLCENCIGLSQTLQIIIKQYHTRNLHNDQSKLVDNFESKSINEGIKYVMNHLINLI